MFKLQWFEMENMEQLSELPRREQEAVTALQRLLPNKFRFEIHDNSIYWIHIYSKEMSRIPEILREFPNLHGIESEYSPLTEVPEWIGDLKNLDTLSIRQAKFTHLPSSFKRLENLQDLLIESTPLKEITLDFPKLACLHLAETNISDISRNKDTLRQLEVLNISSTQIDRFSFLEECKHLTFAYFDCLGLDDSTRLTIPSSPLYLLSLNYNSFHNFPVDLLNNHPELETLLLTNNKIGPRSESYSIDHGLSELDLSANILENILGMVTNFPNLKNVNFYGNPFPPALKALCKEWKCWTDPEKAREDIISEIQDLESYISSYHI